MYKNYLTKTLVLAGVCALASCAKGYDDTAIKTRLDKVEGRTGSVESRLQSLENQIKEANSNITALRALVTALERNVSIRSVVPEDTRGYRIHFSDGKSIVLYHGQRGERGAQGERGLTGARGADAIVPRFKIEQDYWYVSYDNGNQWSQLGKAKGDRGEQGVRGMQGERGIPGVQGERGLAGAMPTIGVRASAGRYYWTVDGQWLRDERGAMVPATGEQGAMGATGAQGATGATGAAGRDGVTPKLRINNDRWEVSYDNGSQWTDLGRAKGDKGDRGDATSSTAGASQVMPRFKIEQDYWYVSYDNGNQWTQLGKAKGDRGERGETGARGPQGEQGARGERGETGARGPQGEQGARGERGETGARGPQGEQGARGERGETGARGPQGEQGARGERGEQGPAGASSNAPATEGGAVFKTITEDQYAVHIQLASGVTLHLPKQGGVSINISEGTALGVLPNKSYELHYTLAGQVGSKTRVYALAQGGYKAKVKMSNTTTGLITIETPARVEETKVLVFVSNDEGQTIMEGIVLDVPGSSSLSGASEGTASPSTTAEASTRSILRVLNTSYALPATGGEVSMELFANNNYRVIIPSEASSWLHLQSQETLRAITRKELIKLRADANTGDARQTSVLVVDEWGTVQTSVLVHQGSARAVQSYHVSTPGTLEELVNSVDRAGLTEIKITGRLNAFDYDFLRSMKQLVKIDLSELSDTKMPNSAFADSKAQVVLLPEGLRAIPDRLFKGSELTKLTIPEGVESIGVSAFEATAQLRGDVIIPSAVRSIAYKAFYASKFDGRLSLGERLETIGGYAFYYASSVVGDLIIPNSVTSLGSHAFYEAKFTGSLTIGSGLTIIPERAFSKGQFAGRLSLGENLVEIGQSAFEDCSKLQGNLIIPDKVERIKERAFRGCRGFSGRLVLGASVKVIETNSFGSISENMKVYCKALTPPKVTNSKTYSTYSYTYTSMSSFGSDTNERIKVLSYLGVPTGSKEAYKSSEWNKQASNAFSFSLIEEIDF